jgi:hypothetical protein
MIRGIPGVYFIEALERDELGPFETIVEAEQEVKGQYGEFIIEE